MRAKDYNFSQKIVGGITFTAFVGREGPYLMAEAGRQRLGDVRISAGKIFQNGERWSICKYGPREVRVALPNFTKEDVETLAQHFGLGVDYRASKIPFNELGMFSDLCDWVEANPVAARKIQPHEPSMGAWLHYVTEAQNAAAAPSL
ncbi:hypothetical protein [Bosea sp. RAC05]|mgnify:CR=1 FL=1|uniref:hypothetical protein n=1 Tax=Bosea sp. RAC05 TaxID=1842539 RepID=UPI00083D086A|nr:hypothetical protein [Bosea sp. RAC05]AOG02921.1 hypothetical protein BSY19_5083 [Bosea sp. RAC05]